MARRMAPSQPVPGTAQAMVDQGITMSRYWERFGGWSGSRDMGLVAYQVGLVFDAMMSERYDLARDHLALLAVCLEQSSYDNGRLDIGYQLTWLEEPPSAMFQSRTGAARVALFAPLASQRWVTVVLSYLKELDVIQSKRNESIQRPPAQRTLERIQTRTLLLDGAQRRKPLQPPRSPPGACLHVGSSRCLGLVCAKIASGPLLPETPGPSAHTCVPSCAETTKPPR